MSGIRGVIVVGAEPHLANVLKLVGNFFRCFRYRNALAKPFTLGGESGT